MCAEPVWKLPLITINNVYRLYRGKHLLVKQTNPQSFWRLVEMQIGTRAQEEHEAEEEEEEYASAWADIELENQWRARYGEQRTVQEVLYE